MEPIPNGPDQWDSPGTLTIGTLQGLARLLELLRALTTEAPQGPLAELSKAFLAHWRFSGASLLEVPMALTIAAP